MDKRERVARAIAMVTDLHPDPLSGLDYERADAAIAALEPEPEPELVTDGPNWEGFGRDLLESWPVRDVDGSELFDAALRNGLIREIPGGYDPEKHIDAECICPEHGDPWYEYAFRALAEEENPADLGSGGVISQGTR